MNIALITVVNPQDNDVFEDMLVYYYNLGIRNYYMMLHKADRILRDIAFVFERDYDVRVSWYFNEKDEHNHDEDVKILTDAALKDGMEWFIGSDADELLVLKQHKNKKEFGFKICNASEFILTVDAFGNIYPCCHVINKIEYMIDKLPGDSYFKNRNSMPEIIKNKGFNPHICPLGCRGSGINQTLYNMILEKHRNFL